MVSRNAFLVGLFSVLTVVVFVAAQVVLGIYDTEPLLAILFLEGVVSLLVYRKIVARNQTK